MERGTSRFAEDIEDRLFSFINFVIKIATIGIFDEHPIHMSHISLPKSAVFFFCFFGGFVAGFGDVLAVELFSSIRRRDHMDDCIIPIVADNFGVEGQVLEDGVPLGGFYVSRSI